MTAKKKQKDSADGTRIIATNRKARHDYHIEKTLEAGLELRGTEVKALRDGKASLVDSYAAPVNNEMWVSNIHIPPYDSGNRFNVDSKRMRKLLLHRAEILKMINIVSQKGYTLVPLRLYFNDRNRVKLELAICRGKHSYDKRQAIKERDVKREMDREAREFHR